MCTLKANYFFSECCTSNKAVMMKGIIWSKLIPEIFYVNYITIIYLIFWFTFINQAFQETHYFSPLMNIVQNIKTIY